MESKDFLETMSQIPVGTIVAFITAVSVVGAGCWRVISKMIKLYDGYKNVQEERDQLKQKVEENTVAIDEVKNQFTQSMGEVQSQLSTIVAALDEQRATKITELRHAITVAGESALAAGEMPVREYKSLHEMADKYIHVYKQNWYVESLIKKVDRDVRVIGQLDDHGNDIE